KQLSKLRLPGVIDEEKKSSTISICSWQQKNQKLLQNFSLRIRWSNPSSPKARQNRACGCGQGCSAICEWSRPPNTRLHSLISPGTKSTISKCAAALCNGVGR